MSTYYYTLFFVSTFSFAAQKLQSTQIGSTSQKRNPQVKFFLICTALTLILVAGLRYGVGTDFFAYYSLEGAESLWTKIKTFDEPGIALIEWVVCLFTDDPAVVIFAYSFLTILLILRTTYRYTDDFLFVTLLFVFTGCWHGSFNGVRQFLAAAILFAGHRYIYEKKLWKYWLIVFLAASVHISAVVMIVPYFVLNLRFRIRNIILLAVGTWIVSANYDTIFSFIGLLKDSEVILDEYNTTVVNIYRVLVACAPALAVAVIYSFNRPDREESFYINAMIMNAAAMCAAANSAYLARVGIYTNLFTPLALSKLIRLKNKQMERFMKIAIVVLYAVFWYIEVSGSLRLSSFRWVWERAAS